MISRYFVAAILMMCAVAPAAADDAAPPDSHGGRYTFSKVADGFVRLDSQTGEVALCSPRTVGWACLAAPEDRAALEREVARLRSENAALKQSLLARGLPLPPGVMPEPPGAHDNDVTIRLPSDAEVGSAVAYVAGLWHRFVEAVVRAQQQMLNKS